MAYDFSSPESVQQMAGAAPGVYEAAIVTATPKITKAGADTIILLWADGADLTRPLVEEVLAVGGAASLSWRKQGLERVQALLKLDESRPRKFNDLADIAQALVSIRARITIAAVSQANGTDRLVVTAVEPPTLRFDDADAVEGAVFGEPADGVPFSDDIPF